MFGPRDRPRKWGPATARPDPRLPKRKTNPQDGQNNAPPGRQQSTTLGPGSQFRTTTDRLWTKLARRWRSIEPSHLAGSVAAGFNADTSNPRSVLRGCASRAVTWRPAGRSQPLRDGSSLRRRRQLNGRRDRLSSANACVATQRFSHLRRWTGQDFYSSPEVSAGSRETCTNPGGRPHPGWDERWHLAARSDADRNDALLQRWQTCRAQSKCPRQKWNALHLLRCPSSQPSCAHARLRPQAVAASRSIKLAGSRPMRQSGIATDSTRSSCTPTPAKQVATAMSRFR